MSLGTLLSHKPDFTPRMGYLWPIAHAKATAEDLEASSRKSQGLDTEDTAATETGTPTKRRKVMAKKQENAALLFNAMRTTASQSLSQAPSDTSVASSVNQPTHSSTVLGPSSAGPSGSGSPQTEDGTAKSQPQGSKKKRKRESCYLLRFS
jgi:mediator of RNA polymerase II transcription subunit 6